MHAPAPVLQALMLESAAAEAWGAALARALASRGVGLDRVRGRGAFERALSAADHHCALLVAPAAADNIAQLFDTLVHGQPSLPVVVATPGASAAERIAWLDRGAEDVVTVAGVDMDELAARVHAAARRAQSRRQPRALGYGPLVLHPDRRGVSWRGEPVSLTAREYALLELLVRGARQPHSRDSLHAALASGDADRASNAVDVHVHALRRKLHPQLIRTVRGVGYRIADAAALDG